MEERSARDALRDARVERREARAGELDLGVGELDAGRATVAVERAADAVALLGGREARGRRTCGDLGVVHGLPGADDLVAQPIAQRGALLGELRALRVEARRRGERGAEIVRRPREREADVPRRVRVLRRGE